jgi:hypothetical protein
LNIASRASAFVSDPNDPETSFTPQILDTAEEIDREAGLSVGAERTARQQDGSCEALFGGTIGRLDDRQHRLVVQTCDEIIAGEYADMFPLHVWMIGSGTQFNMNVNEVISNRCCQLAGTPVGSKIPVHPDDDVNMSHVFQRFLPDGDEHRRGGQRKGAIDFRSKRIARRHRN